MKKGTDRLLILVGAGLVVDAGLPDSITLSKRFHSFLSEEAILDPFGQKSAMLQAFRFLEGGIRFQLGVTNRDPGGPVNIEQLATAALRLNHRQENPITPYVSGWNPRLQEIEDFGGEELLEDFINEIFDRLNVWLATPEDRSITYLSGLLDFREFGALTICSLNYDLCLERAFASVARVEFDNGFGADGRWSPSTLNKAGQVKLLKLHGSLDWVEDVKQYGICSATYPSHSEAEALLLNNRPLLIFGTDTKMNGRDPFLPLFHQFASSLYETELIIAIGYSFMDEHVNEIIEQRFVANPNLRILIVSPDANAIKSARVFMQDSPRVIAFDATAKEALNSKGLLLKAREILDTAKQEDPFPTGGSGIGGTIGRLGGIGGRRGK